MRIKKRKINKFQSSNNVLEDMGIGSNRLAEKAAPIAKGSHSLSPSPKKDPNIYIPATHRPRASPNIVRSFTNHNVLKRGMTSNKKDGSPNPFAK